MSLLPAPLEVEDPTLRTPALLYCAFVAAAALGYHRLSIARTDQRNNRSELWHLFVALCLFSVLPFLVGVLLGDRWSLGPLLVALLLLAPESALRGLAWRFGLHRMAGLFATLTFGTFTRDRRGGELLAAARALLRLGGNRRAEDALLERLTRLHPLRGAGIAAQGLLLLARGEREAGRSLLESVRWLDPRVCPALARQVAVEWLAADAASRGAWSTVEELTRTPVDCTAASSLLRSLALRLTAHAEAPSARALWARWVVAGCPVGALPLVRRLASEAPSAPPAPPPDAPAPPAEEHGSTLEEALAQHAALLSDPAPTASQLCALTALWERALSNPALEHRAGLRAQALGLASPKGALAAFEADVFEDLLALTQRREFRCADLQGNGALLRRLREALASGELTEVEACCDAMRRRVDARRALPAVDEWREFVALRAAHASAVAAGGEELRRLAFPRVHQDVCALAVWLSNERKENGIAHAMFLWLHQEALAAGDVRLSELQRKNASLGPF